MRAEEHGYSVAVPLERFEFYIGSVKEENHKDAFFFRSNNKRERNQKRKVNKPTN